MTNLTQETQFRIIQFIYFYITCANLLILIIIFNNWGQPMNFTLGIQGVKIQIAHPPEPVKSLADQNEGEGGIRRALALRI